MENLEKKIKEILRKKFISFEKVILGWGELVIFRVRCKRASKIEIKKIENMIKRELKPDEIIIENHNNRIDGWLIFR